MFIVAAGDSTVKLRDRFTSRSSCHPIFLETMFRNAPYNKSRNNQFPTRRDDNRLKPGMEKKMNLCGSMFRRMENGSLYSGSYRAAICRCLQQALGVAVLQDTAARRAADVHQSGTVCAGVLLATNKDPAPRLLDAQDIVVEYCSSPQYDPSLTGQQISQAGTSSYFDKEDKLAKLYAHIASFGVERGFRFDAEARLGQPPVAPAHVLGTEPFSVFDMKHGRRQISFRHRLIGRDPLGAGIDCSVLRLPSALLATFWESRRGALAQF